MFRLSAHTHGCSLSLSLSLSTIHDDDAKQHKRTKPNQKCRRWTNKVERTTSLSTKRGTTDFRKDGIQVVLGGLGSYRTTLQYYTKMFRRVCIVASRRSSRSHKNGRLLQNHRHRLNAYYNDKESSIQRKKFFSSGNSDNNDDPINQYLKEEAGIDPKLHMGVLKAMASVYGKDITVDNLKGFGQSGLEALAQSVEEELKKRGGGRKGRSNVPVHVKIPHHNTEFELKWNLGDSLVDLAIDNEELLGEYMEGTCGQNMSCCTCHVYIDDEQMQAHLPKPERAELDMLDLAYDPKDTSRLGCQIELTPELLNANLSKYEFIIPSGVNDVWN